MTEIGLATCDDQAAIAGAMKALFPEEDFADLDDGSDAGMACYAITCAEGPVSSLAEVIVKGVSS